MNKIGASSFEIDSLYNLSERNLFINRVNPVVKLILTVMYILSVISVHKYNLVALIGMVFPLWLLFQIADLTFRQCFGRVWAVLPLVCFIGIANPFFDRQLLFSVGRLNVTGGFLSFVTLAIKGTLAVFASYSLIATTSVDNICRAMRSLHIPDIIVTEFMLMTRYVQTLMQTVGQTVESYSVRSNGQKGVHYSAWGSMVGQILLRSMDKADNIYKSMKMRGFNGYINMRTEKMRANDFTYFLLSALIIGIFRFVPVLNIIGSFFIR